MSVVFCLFIGNTDIKGVPLGMAPLNLSPGHIRHPSAVRSVCGLFAAENRGDRRITLRVPQGVGLNHRGRADENQWSWGVERFANRAAHFEGDRAISLLGIGSNCEYKPP